MALAPPPIPPLDDTTRRALIRALTNLNEDWHHLRQLCGDNPTFPGQVITRKFTELVRTYQAIVRRHPQLQPLLQWNHRLITRAARTARHTMQFTDATRQAIAAQCQDPIARLEAMRDAVRAMPAAKAAAKPKAQPKAKAQPQP